MKPIISLFIKIGAVLLWSISAQAQQKSAQDWINILQDHQAKEVMVIAHRGDWRNAPENSLQAIENCIKMGVAVAEIDIQRSKDGHFVLMHDRTIDRTTNGKGKVENYTLAELQGFYLKDGLGVPQPVYTIPTLEAALKISKGKILLNLDKADRWLEDVLALVDKMEMRDHCIFKSSKPYAEVKAQMGDELEKVWFMPIVRPSNPNVLEDIKEYQEKIKPVAFEVCFPEYDAKTQAIFDAVKQGEGKVWINSLWDFLSGGHSDERAMVEGKDETWGWILEQGATMIQTDRPEALIHYIKNEKQNEEL
ncbi:glycerophosphodiester phosphodiesterase family protein [Flammeovirga sp. EKP202]|uniref:glycerophosphodiester phosphodiesterase family protein n=1 Tax=Flammeovirga sp. EKP202 TaxID=2770592 RepID=UPI00165FC2DF|nr:glycerophosphodiester phosphodiesterase family protein [Flammeovirga sp. EKP202]MBD0400666.1 glycerophosphodiester phosphodiesterase family protein [Flammeovirga sp. EKP202]